MGNVVPVLATPAPLSIAEPGARELVEAFLAGRNERTRRAYATDLEDFRRFAADHLGLELAAVDQVARVLLERGPGAANLLTLRYRAHLVELGRSPATVNRRLAAVRSLVKLARTLGLVTWALEVESIKGKSYRDTRGPGELGVRKLLRESTRRTDAKGLRDHAIIRLLHDLALRRGELVALDLADLDLEAGAVWILGKGQHQKARLTLPRRTQGALRAWLAVRGDDPGPVFTHFDRASKGTSRRLSGRSVARVVGRLGQRAGLTARPHGLRHAAITAALDETGGNLRAVQRYSRHADVRTVAIYDDNREDLGGQIAELVAEVGGEGL